MRKRDSQKKKFWKILELLSKEHPEPELTFSDTEAFILKVIDSSWFLNRYGKMTVNMTDGRRRRSYAWVKTKVGWEYRLPRFARKKTILLRLIAHSQVPEGEAWHGREFAKIYLELLGRWVGEDVQTTVRGYYSELRIRHKNKRRSHLEIVKEQLGLGSETTA